MSLNEPGTERAGMGWSQERRGSDHLLAAPSCWRAGLAQDLPSGPFLCCWLKEWACRALRWPLRPRISEDIHHPHFEKLLLL